MPSFPFGGSPPTLERVINICIQAHDARLVELPEHRNGNKVLVRNSKGKDRHAVLQDFAPGEQVPISLIRSICDRLDIPFEEFGFNFDRKEGPKPPSDTN